MVWLFMILLALLVALSLWLRVVYYRAGQNNAESRASPLSLAIQELVGTAGGIYLAVITLTSFLKLDIPDKITLARVSLDPLALCAIGVAIVQPVVLRVFNNKTK